MHAAATPIVCMLDSPSRPISWWILRGSAFSLDIGPTRHGLTHGATIYFFDPSGNRNETFCGGDYFFPDHPVVTWDADKLGKAVFYHSRELNERFLTVTT